MSTHRRQPKRSRTRGSRQRQRARRWLHAEQLEGRLLLAADLPFHNAAFPADANVNQYLDPGDARVVINEINRSGARALSEAEATGGAEAEGGPSKMVDVDGDNFLTPSDARRVINLLNAEGEPGDVIRVILQTFAKPANYPYELQSDIDHDFNPNTPTQDALVRVPATQLIGQIGVGQEFVVKLFVEDIRQMGNREGVFSLYADVNFNGALASLVQNLPNVLHPQTANSTPYLHNFDEFSKLNGQPGVVNDYARNFGGIYGERAEPSVGNGLIDTNNDSILDQIDFVGSFSGQLSGPGEFPFLLVEWVMRADAEGNLVLSAEPTTEDPQVDPNDDGESPLFDPGIFGQDAPVCPSQTITDPCMGEIQFVSAAIDIVADVVAVDDSLTLEEDGSPGTIDVLANDLVFSPPTADPALVSFTDPPGISVSRNTQGTQTQTDDTLTVTPDPNFNGQVIFQYTISNGDGGQSLSSADVTVDIEPINDGPINSIPGPQTIDEDTELIFSGGALSVSDIDADDGTGLEVNVSVGNGILTASPSGATITNNNSNAVTIDGSVAEVNAALNGLTYAPNLNFNGNDALQISTNDKGNTGGVPGNPGQNTVLSDNDTVNITIEPINDGPINTVPGAQTLFNTQTLAFTAGPDVKLWTGPFSVDDVDASELEVNLTVGEGTVSFTNTSGLTSLNGNNSTDLTARGSLSNLNNALGSLVYDPTDSFFGIDTLTMTTSDLGGTGQGNILTDTDSVSITVTPPQLPFAASDFFDTEEDDSLTIDPDDLLTNDIKRQQDMIEITDVGGQPFPFSDGQSINTSEGGSLTYSAGSGLFTYAPLPEFFGLETFEYTIESDNPNDDPSIGTVNITVQPINDGPLNFIPGPQEVDEDDSLDISGVSVADVDADFGSGLTVTLTVGNGTLSVDPGATVDASNPSRLILNGTVSQINNSLGGLTYSPLTNFNGLDSLEITTEDNGNVGGVPGNPGANNPLSDLDTVDITVQPINDGPLIVVPSQQTFITDFDNVLSTDQGNAIQIDDVDAEDDDVQVDLTVTQGSLSLVTPGGVTVDPISGGISLTGSVSEINTALGLGVNYRTNDEGFKTLTATVNDLGNNGGVAGDPDAVNPLSASGDVIIEVLDFVPSTLGGFVFVDVNNDANKGSNEAGLEGVRIMLSGRDFRNNPVSMETFTDHTGKYLFPNLQPGDYDLDQEQPANLKDGLDSFQSPVQFAANDSATVQIPIRGDVQSMNNNFGERGLTTRFVSLYDLVDSQFQRSAVLLSSDGSNDWSAFLGAGWEGFSNPRIDMTLLTFTVFDISRNEDRQIDLRAVDQNNVMLLNRIRTNRDGNQEVTRIIGSAFDFNLTETPPDDDNANPEGEGGLADGSQGDAAAQYAAAVDRIFAGTA